MPSPPFPPPTGEYSDHKANCHCGAVRFTFFISPPLDNYPVVECNCSICQRNGYLLVYPVKENLKLGEGSGEAMGSYCFGNNNVKHNFCKQCGSSLFFEVLSPPHDAAAEAERRGEKLPVIMGVNLRMVTGLEVDKLIIKKVDGEGREPKYAVR
ncbi:Mss4-like protein [Diaporthe sp. PMI_573]|nr:Mss4-like protein [Diaporthaceae sp. PMI_573]